MKSAKLEKEIPLNTKPERLTLYTRILILYTWHSIVKSKWRRTEEVRLTTFSCFLTPFHERTMKMWSALFDASIQEDVDSPLFLFETARGLWLSGRTKHMLTTSTTLLWTGWRWWRMLCLILSCTGTLTVLRAPIQDSARRHGFEIPARRWVRKFALRLPVAWVLTAGPRVWVG